MPDASLEPSSLELSAEMRGFLERHTRTFLFTRRADGSVTGYPMLGLWNGETLDFSTYRASAKVRNIERDNRVSCLVTSADGDPDPRVLVLVGEARVSSEGLPGQAGDPEAAPAADRALPSVPKNIVDTATQRMSSGKRVVVRVAVERAWMRKRPS